MFLWHFKALLHFIVEGQGARVFTHIPADSRCQKHPQGASCLQACDLGGLAQAVKPWLHPNGHVKRVPPQKKSYRSCWFLFKQTRCGYRLKKNTGPPHLTPTLSLGFGFVLRRCGAELHLDGCLPIVPCLRRMGRACPRFCVGASA